MGAGTAPETGNNGNHEPCWRVSGANDLTPQQVAVLQELCTYRDHVARSINRPLFKVISDETLLSIAASTPDNLDALEPDPRDDLGPDPAAWLCSATGGGTRLASRRRFIYTRSPRPDDQFLARLDRLRQWRKKTAQEIGVKSDVVLARDLLFALAEQNPQYPGGVG